MAQSSTRSRLLTTALAHFARHGLAARTKAISTEAGVDEATLFRLFGSKRDLFRAVISSTLEEHFRKTLELDFEKFEISFADGIRHFARGFSAALRTPQGDALERALYFAVLDEPELVAGWVENQVLPVVLRLGEVIQRAIDRGEADHPRPYIAARILIDSLVGSHHFLVWFGANKLPEFSCTNPEDLIIDMWLGWILVSPEKKAAPSFVAPDRKRRTVK